MTSHRQSPAALPRMLAVLGAAAAIVAGSSVFGALADKTASRIRFTAMQQDVAVDGEFRQFSADVDFDPARPGAGRVNLVIDVASVATGNGEADAMLRGKDFFDAAHYPQATFVARAISPAGPGHFQASGQLTLKGRSRDIVVPFAAAGDQGGLRIDGTVPVSRLAYRIGEGEWADTGTLADLVPIRFSLVVPR